MSGYIGAIPTPQATQSRDVYTATSNQTTFTTQGYTPGFVSVYLNGVHLARADFTATNGSDVVLASGATVNDTVEIVSFGTFQSADALPLTGGTVTGTVNFPDGSISISDLDIDGGTDIGAALVDADLMIVDDGAGGTNRKATMSRLATYMGTKGLGPSYTRGTTAPSSPNAGDWWLNTNSNQPSTFIYDGTLGWIQSDGTALGLSSYLAGNSFSLICTGSSVGRMDVVRFEGVLPQQINQAATYTDNTGHPIALSNTVRAIIRVHDTSATNALEFVAFANLGKATTFGNTNTTPDDKAGGISHATRGIIAGGEAYVNHMEYITIGTEGNGTDFGDLTVARGNLSHACVASTTRGIIMGGNTGSASNVMDYVTIANTGNATDFGNLTESKSDVYSAHSTTRGLRIGGSSDTNVIDYITMGSTGNATDFGDLTTASNSDIMYVVHNGTYAWTTQYVGSVPKTKITMATAGNAVEITDGSGPFGVQTSIQAASTTSVAKGWIAATG